MRVTKYALYYNQWIQLQPEFVVGRFLQLNIHSDGFAYLIYVVSGSLQLPSFPDISEGSLVLLPSNIELQLSDIDCIIFRLPQTVFPTSETESIYLDLDSSDHINKWVVGYGDQAIKSKNFSLANVAFENQTQFEQQLLPREFYHKHHYGVEYYLVLQGSNTVEVADEIIQLDAFELLEVPTGLCHHWIDATYPQKGLNFRYPSIDGDKELCSQ